MAALLYVLTHSTEEPDRAVTGLATALAASRAGHDVVLWLSGEGVRLGVTGVAETLHEPWPENAAAMLADLVERGVVLHVERLSFERRQYGTDALRRGAELADAERLAELLAGGWAAVSL